MLFPREDAYVVTNCLMISEGVTYCCVDVLRGLSGVVENLPSCNEELGPGLLQYFGTLRDKPASQLTLYLAAEERIEVLDDLVMTLAIWPTHVMESASVGPQAAVWTSGKALTPSGSSDVGADQDPLLRVLQGVEVPVNGGMPLG